MARRLKIAIPVLLVSGLCLAADELPRTSWGTPDLSGRWDYSSLTPLERPEAFKDRTHFTPEEAADFVRNFDRYVEDQLREFEGDSFVGVETWLEWGAAVEPDLRDLEDRRSARWSTPRADGAGAGPGGSRRRPPADVLGS